MKHLLIFGANSFLGQALIAYFLEQPEFKITAISRSEKHHFPAGVKHLIWDGKTEGTWTSELRTADHIINLAGKSVNCRYTPTNKAAIYTSRIESTEIIAKMIRKHLHPNLKCWINSSSATIYDHEEQIPNTENTGRIGSGFSVDVCQKWEAAFFREGFDDIRQVAIRSTIVLGKKGGVLPVLKKLAHRGIGGKMGSGEQYFSWIHERDFCRALHFLLLHHTFKGIVNLASPNPVKNKNFQQLIRETEGIKCYLNQPEWLLKIGAIILGTETELVLKSRYVISETLQKQGFQFKYPKLIDALIELKN